MTISYSSVRLPAKWGWGIDEEQGKREFARGGVRRSLHVGGSGVFVGSVIEGLLLRGYAIHGGMEHAHIHGVLSEGKINNILRVAISHSNGRTMVEAPSPSPPKPQESSIIVSLRITLNQQIYINIIASNAYQEQQQYQS